MVPFGKSYVFKNRHLPIIGFFLVMAIKRVPAGFPASASQNGYVHCRKDLGLPMGGITLACLTSPTCVQIVNGSKTSSPVDNRPSTD